jgi:hypothetical protein
VTDYRLEDRSHVPHMERNFLCVTTHKNFFPLHELISATGTQITGGMKKLQSERCLTSCNGEIENEWSYTFIPTDILYIMFSVQEYFSHTEYYN